MTKPTLTLKGLFSIRNDQVTHSGKWFCWGAWSDGKPVIVLTEKVTPDIQTAFYLYEAGDQIVLQDPSSGKYLTVDANGLAAKGDTVGDAARLEMTLGKTDDRDGARQALFFVTSKETGTTSIFMQGGDDSIGPLIFEAELSGDVLHMALFCFKLVPDLLNSEENTVKYVQDTKKGRSFPWADLSGLDLSGVDFEGCDLSHTVLVETDLREANLKGVNFSNCDLREARFDAKPDFGQAGDTPANFHKAIVPYSILERNWSNLDSSEATIKDVPVELSTKDTPLMANHADMSQLQGLSKTLRYACFDDATMNNVSLSSADLEGATFRRAYLKGTRFTNANLKCADLTGAFLIAKESGADPEPADFSDAFMANAVLDNVRADGVVFEGAQMYSYVGFDGYPASARSAFLNLAKFGKANLFECDMSDAKLQGAGFIEANLVNARLENVDLTSYPGTTPTPAPVRTPASLSKTDLRGTNLAGARMQGTDLIDAKCAPSPGKYKCCFPDGTGGEILIDVDYIKTELGTTDKETVCPNGNNGPCTFR